LAKDADFGYFPIVYFNTGVVFCVKEHLDYDIVQSTNPEFRKAIVRVNVYRDHRQTVQV